LPLDELNSIILEDELNVKSEEVVWEAVLRWVNYEPDIRWQHTVKLMGSIRLGLLDTQVRYSFNLYLVVEHVRTQHLLRSGGVVNNSTSNRKIKNAICSSSLSSGHQPTTVHC
jgi:hypothetical protein